MTKHDSRTTEDLLAQNGQKPVGMDLPDIDVSPDYDRPHFKDNAESNDDIDLILDENPFDLDGPDHSARLILRLLLNMFKFPLILVRMVRNRIGSHKFDRAIELSPAFEWIRANRPLKVKRGKVRLSDLSLDKRYILEMMTNDEVGVMLAEFRSQAMPDKKESEDYEGDLKLDAETMSKVKACRNKKSRLDAQETRWLTTVETLLRCKYQKPQGFDDMTPQQIYHKLFEFLVAHHLPEAFIRSIVPALVYYVVNGEMRRPLMIVGNPGAGKTTAFKVICSALGMLYYHFDAAARDSSHGLLGEAKTFQSCENGEMVYGVCKTGVINPVFIIDEPEKTSTPLTRTSFQDDLLALCDGTHEDYTDNFLRFSLPLKGIIFMFTVNSTDSVSAPLLDRCEVIRFKDIEEARVEDIIVDYAKDELQTMLYKGVLELDDKALRRAVASLYSHGIHSVRQHQKMVDKAFRAAFNSYVFQTSPQEHSIVVGQSFLSEAIEQGDYAYVKKAGF